MADHAIEKDYGHKPVLLQECLDALAIRPDGVYVDGTLGGGGHSAEILRRLNGTGHLYGIDRDNDALAAATERLGAAGNFTAVKGNFHDVKALLPTTAQSSASAYAPAAVYAESEEVTDEPPREMTKADMQREQIVRALRRNNGRRREAAAELFMSERTLYRKIKELGIDENS